MDHDLFSIDRVSSSAGDVIATGRSNISGHPQITWVYKLNAAMWGSCTIGVKMKYKQPPKFSPYVLNVGLNFCSKDFEYSENRKDTIDYDKTFFCE